MLGAVPASMSRKFRVTIGALIGALCIAACGSSSSAKTGSSSSPAAKSTSSAATKAVSGHTTVTIKNYMFSPMHLTVTKGTRVSFHNYDVATHTATALNQSFDTGDIKQNQTKTITFSKPGTYKYHCLFHAFMTATITVVPAAGS